MIGRTGFLQSGVWNARAHLLCSDYRREIKVVVLFHIRSASFFTVSALEFRTRWTSQRPPAALLAERLRDASWEEHLLLVDGFV